MPENYTTALLEKMRKLRLDIAEYQRLVQEIFEKIDQKQKQAQHIVELLKIEGMEPDKAELDSLGQTSVADLAYQYLAHNDSIKPLHYRELANAIMGEGKLIPGKDPAANLLSHMGRDDRFVRVSPGTYGLKEWGIQPALKKRTLRRRKTGQRSKKRETPNA